MRLEKNWLVQEAVTYLHGSDYLYLLNFARVRVEEVAELRRALRAEGAVFHVVKNSILQLALQGIVSLDLKPQLSGPTAIVTRGSNPSGVAKILLQFRKQHEDKLVLKCGALANRFLSPEEVKLLSELPPLEELRARFLALLQEPARRILAVFQGVPQGLLRVLKAKGSR
ncbi:MAG: 50S ribosomal protein L10 [Puniceicoccales bacterium]|jgi:large subunit ribosomal protein L10|nr:50S ribosomal protein L10 [Puniceicoccales bacterium]